MRQYVVSRGAVFLQNVLSCPFPSQLYNCTRLISSGVPLTRAIHLAIFRISER